jgi:hypothetical protein
MTKRVKILFIEDDREDYLRLINKNIVAEWEEITDEEFECLNEYWYEARKELSRKFDYNYTPVLLFDDNAVNAQTVAISVKKLIEKEKEKQKKAEAEKRKKEAERRKKAQEKKRRKRT